ncbi:MAG: zf-TFIIB domain-containing protein [Myxococcota bacterium]|nr:zf-TFIIB domain-containing protein [Myxococcota bacterium]
MNCPKCPEQLHEMTIDLVPLDFCSGCKGVWFDSKETSAYFELVSDIPDLEAAAASARPTPYVCPRCGDGLEEIVYTTTSDLLVDRCKSCSGVWLDSGEVQTLNELSRTLQSPGARLAAAATFLKSKGYDIVGVQKS